MNHQHKTISQGGWQKLSLIEQLANIGSEIERTISWRKKNNFDYSQMAFFRGLELLELTLNDKKNKFRLKELTRLYEVLGDYFIGNNQYHSTDLSWQKYFYAFSYAARINK